MHTEFESSGGTVPASYVGLLFGYLAARGQDAARLLGETGPDAGGGVSTGVGAGRSTPSSYPVAHWRRLLGTASAALQEPALGLLVGASITPAHLGPLGYVLSSSNSVAEAIARYIRCQRLVHDVSPVRHAVQEGRVVLEWSAESRTVGLLVNQCGMAALARFAADLTEGAARPCAVYFVEPQPPDLQPYQDLFGCPVLFGQAATRMDFPLAVLAMPLRRADPALAQMLDLQVQAMLAALPARSSALEQAIRQSLPRLMLNGEPELGAVARELSLSARTLRRRLHEQGLNFRALLDDTRRRLAQDYLADGQLALAEVALLLGYSEQSAFNRATQRWTGMTPRRWRMALTTGATGVPRFD
jgi:AraC-like DNA-binding protein